MSSTIAAITVAAALGCGLAAGIFFAFSTFVMRALGQLPPTAGIAAMQRINVTVINPWFMTAFLGTAALCVVTVVAAIADWHGSYGPYLVVAAVLYLIGVIGVTGAYHEPRNKALATIDPIRAQSAGAWRRYLADWTRWNHVRTVAPLVAAALEIGALNVS